VLLAGGYEKNLGVGQTIEAELYDPATHTFHGFGCMAMRRAHCSGIEIQHFFSGFPKSVGRPSDKNTEAMEQMMLV
jgi:hypothetical protein